MQIVALVPLIFLSAFFTMTVTALMAPDHQRLRHLSKRGSERAAATLWLLKWADKILSLILIPQLNTLINAPTAAPVTASTILMFNNSEWVLMLAMATVAVRDHHLCQNCVQDHWPNLTGTIALPVRLILKPLVARGKPVIWFVN